MHPAPTPNRAARRPRADRLGLAGAVLVVLGLVLCVAYRFTASNEPHSYAADAVAPYEVGVTQGRLYHLAVHRGIDAEQDLGLVPAALACTYAVQPGAERPLTLTAEESTSKATNVIGTFRSPVTGRVHVACSGLPPVFVDDADDAPADRSGWYLLLGIVTLTVGVPLLLSAVRTALRTGLPGSGRLGQHHQIE